MSNSNGKLKNNYRYLVFNYIGGSVQGTSTRNKKTKHVFHITGRNGKFGYSIFLILILTILAFSFIREIVSALGFSNNMFGLLDTVNRSGFLYSLIEPFTILDINFIFFIFVIILVILKRRKIYKNLEPVSSNINIYSRDLPSNLRPAHMRILVNDGLIDEVSMGSTIVDLIDKGYLEYYKERNEDDKLNFFHSEDSKLIKTAKPHDDLLKYEKFIIDWFIDDYGNGIEVTASQVKQGLLKKQIHHNMEPADMFYEWQALVLMSFPINKYYIKMQSSKKLLYLLIGMLGFMGIMTYIGTLVVVYCFGMFLLACPGRALNQTGVDEVREWFSLKKFLVDFGDMKNKTAEMVILWNFYLTYSIALNVSQKASQEITDFFGENICLGKFESDFKTTIANSFKKEVVPTNNVDAPVEDFYQQKEMLKLEIEEEYKKL